MYIKIDMSKAICLLIDDHHIRPSLVYLVPKPITRDSNNFYKSLRYTWNVLTCGNI